MDASKDSGRQLWFTRRDGRVSGPHPGRVVSRYLLLGRLEIEDQISTDGEHWKCIAEHPHLIPEELLNTHGPEGHLRLLQARLREDERIRERRTQAPEETEEDGQVAPEARACPDRRRSEPPEILNFRQQRAELLERRPRDDSLKAWMPWVLFGGLLGLLLLAGLLVSSLGRTPPSPPPDCQAPAAPGVNWSYCRMLGVDLRGADLTGAVLNNADLLAGRLEQTRLTDADLSYADLRQARFTDADLGGARLTGAILVEARLIRSRLTGADLSYADLRGADLSGADLTGALLSRAVWVDGRICAAGSVGTCQDPTP
ncbi:pentapeptide repeat-containing protein [Ectothiorhodospira lacustris]|uniref:pentapeptide repeat-containing protein n=1 Tax=Ectothiorhodospira lacustris TaxID=2899127 RepID=UPI001EE89CEF|nr:pentapeptide repeat-containing protein [Ectothiorhodospira lacustris]MCG5500754.1 pentapeptide repeat-containing protein [Ectothiorhodospira lacustris]MCG5510890.1 pentapeptide repeat-containing protein [Ectothiorhodospira lacustris]MCG5522564.1 pentapeptide repeat-containing protein [Ectothiorhodospira lacustris]